MRILLGEDDLLLADGSKPACARPASRWTGSKTGVSARSALEVVDYDGMVLDINLPRLSGGSTVKPVAAPAMPARCRRSPPAIRGRPHPGPDAGGPCTG